jgi:hypothetical protein
METNIIWVYDQLHVNGYPNRRLVEFNIASCLLDFNG